MQLLGARSYVGRVATMQIGQALRILQVHGYHTNVSSRFNEGQDLMRCQNIWWTVYVLERRISVLMGAPLSISDNDISASLPNSSDSLLKTTTTATHIKVSQAFSQVVNGMPPLPASLSEADSDIYVAVYRENRHKGSAFVKNTQEVLQRVAKVAPDLHEYFPVPEQDAMDGISRVSGYMNLFYHQVGLLPSVRLAILNFIISA